MIDQEKRNIIRENFDEASRKIRHISEVIEYNAESFTENDVLNVLVQIPILLDDISCLQRKLAVSLNKKFMKDLFKE